MRFYCGPSKAEKRAQRLAAMHEKAAQLREWHRVFAWLPVRIGDQCVVWETVERRFPDAYVLTDDDDPQLYGTAVQYR